VGGLKLDLPLDEDDYLMPSTQQNQNNTTYMDIIGDSKVPGQYSVYQMCGLNSFIFLSVGIFTQIFQIIQFSLVISSQFTVL